jgi:hypothetical protein
MSTGAVEDHRLRPDLAVLTGGDGYVRRGLDGDGRRP